MRHLRRFGAIVVDALTALILSSLVLVGLDEHTVMEVVLYPLMMSASQFAQYLVWNKTLGEWIFRIRVESDTAKRCNAMQWCFRSVGQGIQVLVLPLILVPLFSNGQSFADRISETKLK